jgi:hypothetical protein
MRLAYQSQRQSPEERIRTRALRFQHLVNGNSDGFDDGVAMKSLTSTSMKSSASQAKPPNSGVSVRRFKGSFTFDNPDY